MNFVRADFFASAILEISKKKKKQYQIYIISLRHFGLIILIFLIYMQKNGLSFFKNDKKK